MYLLEQLMKVSNGGGDGVTTQLMNVGAIQDDIKTKYQFFDQKLTYLRYYVEIPLEFKYFCRIN